MHAEGKQRRLETPLEPRREKICGNSARKPADQRNSGHLQSRKSAELEKACRKQKPHRVENM